MNPGCSTYPDQDLPARTETARGALHSALVALAGGSLLAVGLVGLVLPLPGVLLIALGLSVLGTRFTIARRWLDSMQRGLSRLRSRRASSREQARPAASDSSA